jgi:DNA-binding response OmpR family regulator
MADVLIAEDDADIREWVALALSKARYHVRTVVDGAEALVAYAEKRPDVLILDIMMPRKSGYDVCMEIRRKDRHLPIMMLTAKGTERDKVLGLDLGADDYLSKPFGLGELKARVAALLRRAAVPSAGMPGETIRYGTYVVDVAGLRIRADDGAETPLTPLELGLLRYLAAHPGEAISRDRLLNALWGISYMGTTRTLDQRINLLRKKLGPESDRIETVYGCGYRFRAD